MRGVKQVFLRLWPEQLDELGNRDVTKSIARVGQIFVGRIGHERKLMRAGIGMNRVLPNMQPRTMERELEITSSTDPTHTCGCSGASKKLKQKRFHLIIRMMRQGDVRRAETVGRSREEVKSTRPCHRFGASRRRDWQGFSSTKPQAVRSG